MPTPRRQSQMGLEEDLLDSPDLERMLDDRETAKEALKPYRRDYKNTHDAVKIAIDKMELPDGTYRCGDFVVKISEAEEKHIEFERTSTKRLSIKVAKTNR